MSGGKRFVLDANIFIEAHQSYYAFDICPGFWIALRRQHDAKKVFSIDQVRAELVAIDDRLKGWIDADVPETFFKGTVDAAVVKSFGELVNWVQNEPQFTAQAKAGFASVADGWVVAYARANGLVVVTHELYAPEAQNRVPIPNLCLEFEVEYCDTFDLLRELKEKFVVQKRRRKA